MPSKERVLILGAAGRDFHNFNVLYRNNPDAEVVGFTATQIPRIAGREYPPELSGELYPKGLQIVPEEDLEKIVRDQSVDTCLLSYSDLSHTTVMGIAARVLASGADFKLAAPQKTMLPSCKPVIAVCAVRTGCGKSQVSRYIIDRLEQVYHKKCVLVRHPMPYGVLAEQMVQRFESWEDLERHKVTIEEREEYEQHIAKGTVVYAGVDYEAILREAEKEADVVIWDGGNNDTPFFRPDLWVCIADPHRPGHERNYWPGDVNFRMADAIVINKANTASPEAVAKLQAAAAELNPRAHVYVTNSEVTVEKPKLVEGKRALLVEDGPTLTHGGMTYGAGKFAADKYGAAEVVDPLPCLKGSLVDVFERYPHLGKLVPAMGYWPQQVEDLQATVNAVDADVVIIATPFDMCRLLKLNKPAAVARYKVEDRTDGGPKLSEEVDRFVEARKGGE